MLITIWFVLAVINFPLVPNLIWEAILVLWGIMGSSCWRWSLLSLMELSVFLSVIHTWMELSTLGMILEFWRWGSCGLSFICCAMNLAIIHSFLVSDLPFLFLAPYDFVVNLLDNSTILILEADLYHFPDEMLLIHQKIMQHKLVFIETQDVVETTLALDNYRKACDCGRGAVFFSVARYYWWFHV